MGMGMGSSGAAGFGTSSGGGGVGVSGRMGEQGGLRTGWLAAFGTEGYDGEPGLLEELGVNFGHIRTKVSFSNKYSFIDAGGVPGERTVHSFSLPFSFFSLVILTGGRFFGSCLFSKV
jgi:protein YIPF5/7